MIRTIKKILGPLFIIFILTLGSYTYGNQDVTKNFIKGDTIDFSCESSCVIDLFATKNQVEVIMLSWIINGTWKVGYAYYVEGQIIPWKYLEIANNTLSTSFFPQDMTYYEELPNEARIVILIQGKVNTKKLHVTIGQKNIWQQFNHLGKSLISSEWLRLYSINLRYWLKVVGIPIPKILYLLFIVGLVIIFITPRLRNKIYKNIVIWISLLVLLLWVRSLIDITQTLSQWVTDWTKQPIGQKEFFDKWDYYEVVRKYQDIVNSNISKDGKNECLVYMDAEPTRPFKINFSSVHKSPCTITKTLENADYIVMYNKPLEGETPWLTLLEQHNESFIYGKTK